MISEIFFIYLMQIKYTMIFLKKLMVFLMVFAILNVISNIADFVLAYIKGEKLEKSLWEKLVLGTSISYIFTIIFTGFVA